MFRDVDAVMVGLSIFDEKIINMAPNLKILSKHGVGYDNVDAPAATKRKIPDAGKFGIFFSRSSHSIREYTLIIAGTGIIDRIPTLNPVNLPKRERANPLPSPGLMG